MASDKIKLPMYFASLELRNIKCFGEPTILDLTDENGNLARWTLILGDNGVGKTTLLKCLAWSTPVISPRTTEEEKEREEANQGKTPEEIEASETILIKPFMDDLDDEAEFERLIRVGTDMLSDIDVTFAIGTELGSKPEVQRTVSIGMHFERQKGRLEKITPKKGSLKNFDPPTVYAYGANRYMGKQNLNESLLKDPIFNLFSNVGALYDADEVLANLEYASLKEETKERGKVLFEKVKRILADLLPEVKGPGDFIIGSPLGTDNSLGRSRVEVRMPSGSVPISELSLGYQTMLAWTLDLALRMFWQNPAADSPLEEPAIVILDEIDLHLHPRWQRDICSYLTYHFRNAQFICTAHSPFMAQASVGNNFSVLHLRGNEVEIQNDPEVVETWRIGQFATSELFALSSERNKGIQEKIERRRTLLDKRSRDTKEEKELKELDEELGRLPVDAEGSTERLIDELKKFSENVKGGGQAS